MSLSVKRSEESFRVVFCSSKLQLRIFFEDWKRGGRDMRVIREYMENAKETLELTCKHSRTRGCDVYIP